jgi:hypothetical protein
MPSFNTTASEAREIAREAYLFGYPLVLMELTRKQVTNVEKPVHPFGPMNQFAHARDLPGPEFKVVIRPNADTLYSSGNIDLGPEPVILKVPASDRYFMIPFLDFWTNVFAVPGTRTTGPNTAREFLFVAPGWSGDVPDGLEVIRAPTRYIAFIGRTQLNGESDYANVHRIQDEMALVPLSAYGKGSYEPPLGKVDPTIDMTTPPPETVAGLAPDAFFAMMTMLMADNPPSPQDTPTLHRMARLGMKPAQPFALSDLPAELRAAVQEGVAEAREGLVAEYDRLNGASQRGWVYTTEGGSYGVNYLLRAGVAAWGLGMNLPQDAVYPSTAYDSEGRPLDGANRYVLRFPPGQLPPVDAFWSLTAYDSEGYFIPNPINRHAIGDRSNLETTPGGAVEIAIQSERPASGDSNWLPVAADKPFNLMLRLYSPRRSFLEGKWQPPAVIRLA